MERRAFLRGGAGLVLAASATGAAGGHTAAARRGTVRETARDVPVVERADVVVCGGGPAGVAAALAAARSGAATRLIEVHGCLGGVWTAGLLSNVIDYGNKRGIMQELIDQLDARHARFYGSKYDVEVMKLLLEELCQSAGVRIRLHTRVVAVVKDGDQQLTHVVTESKSGREAFAGRVFIDATGDGDVGALAGCRFQYGHPKTGAGQPMSFIVHLVGLELDEVRPFVSGLPGQHSWAEPKGRLAAEIRRATGQLPSYSSATLFHLGQDLYALMANHQYGARGFHADEVTRATLQARREVHRMVDGLRRLGGIWKNIRLCASPEQIGVRESRRIEGLYTVSTDDLLRGARFDDAVCRATFCIDIHSTDPQKTKSIERHGMKAVPYDIPYRALIAKDVRGLLLAGRCISGDFYAHASYRVTGNAVPMGEAAGVAAALAAETNRLPHQIPWPQIKARLDGTDRPPQPAGKTGVAGS